ncbi:ABC transporter substrate-binding protein [Gordonia sp. KTR9]|uniref:ABC transporter substrate-binding protein n=1 Tax=Gordonia sp. KTR9 TaxID=337191 RepID=UPI00027DDE22|nr:ABC transporter substrate-binding protein [Gordonia sp. KTR9]AFR47284.1 ABC-type dipeptide transport system, periplasmic component [Gordonia sp. KTR9]
MATPTTSVRHKRRHRTKATVLATLTACLIAACGSGNGGDSPAATGDPVDGGTLRFASASGPGDCLDPHQSPADVAGFYARPILDSLVALNKDGTLAPWLATEWSVSPDQRTCSFTLRDDVTFSNGEKFDGNAVKANFDHIVDPATKSQLAANTIATYTGTKVIDPTHVEVTFSEPNSAFLPSAATAYLGIEAPSTLTKGPDALCSKIVGTGPFVSPDGYQPNKGIDYVRNDAYNWGPGNAGHTGKAYLQGISIKEISEDSSRYGALTSNQVDAIASVPPVNVSQLKETPGFTVDTEQAPGGNYNYYPNTARGAFADLKVREAFRAGINWDAIVDKLYFGVFQPAKNTLSPATVGYNKESESAYAFDEDKANTLLDEAGWIAKDGEGYRTKNGQRLTVVHPFLADIAREQRDTLLEQVQSSAKKLGIDYQIKNVTVDEYLSRLYRGDYDVADISWQRASPDALRTLSHSSNIPALPDTFGTNFARYSNPAVDADLVAALGETDLTKQSEIYGRAQQQIADDAAVFPVFVFNYALGRRDKVQGVEFEPQAFPTFYDAWLAP